MKLLNLGWSVALSGALSGGFCAASVQAQPDMAPGTIANPPVQTVRAAAPRRVRARRASRSNSI